MVVVVVLVDLFDELETVDRLGAQRAEWLEASVIGGSVQAVRDDRASLQPDPEHPALRIPREPAGVSRRERPVRRARRRRRRGI